MCEVRRFAASRRCTAALLLILAATAFNTVKAAEPYVEAGIVGSELETTAFIRQATFAPEKEFDKERSAGWRIAGGYRLTRYLALEAGYADFGTKTVEDVFVRLGVSSSTRLEEARIDIKGPYVAVIGSASAGNWHPFAKLGLLRADTSASVHTVFTQISGARTDDFVSHSAKSTEALFGVGVSYRPTEHYGVALELSSVPNAGDEDSTGEDDLKALSLSFQYTF